jgi:glucose/arabinose dehydrogenase
MKRIPTIALFCAAFLLSCESDSPQKPGGGNRIPPEFIEPVWEYSHSVGNSVTGGYVYRGSNLPDLAGKYIYADYGRGKIWALSYDGVNPATNELVEDASFRLSSLGVAADGRLFFVGYGAGESIYGLSGTFDIPSSTWDYAVEATFGPFDNAVDLRHAGDDRLFVVLQAGQILVFDPKVDPLSTTTFLDLHTKVTSGGELGLLGLAFHPDYSTNGYFFVYYTTGTGPWTSHLARFHVSPDPDIADAGSEVELLSLPQQYDNHNGGGMAFDGDGYLLLGLGDEGLGGDPNDNAQDVTDLHGALLRLDVNVETAPYYQIPPDNPFADGSEGRAPEIFAYGLRNPWRVSYDAASDRIWVGDVGQGQWEEIDDVVSGGNYGWDCREGAHDYSGPPGGPSSLCAGTGE